MLYSKLYFDKVFHKCFEDMKIPSNELYVNKESSEKYDSDITIVTDSQEKKHKKKHKLFNGNSEENSQKQLSVEASQSLLQPKKKKKLSSLNISFSNEQSQSMPSETNRHTIFTDVITDDESENCSQKFKKLKKKKRRGTISEDLFRDGDVIPVKKRKNNIDLFSQDIFKQPSSEDFLSSTPKKEKKNNGNDDKNNLWSPVRKTKPNNHKPFSLDYNIDITSSKKRDKNNSIDIFQQNSSVDIISSTPEKKKAKKSKGSNDSDNERIKMFKPIDFTEIPSIKKNKKKKHVGHSITSDTSNISLKNENGTAKLEIKNENNGIKKHKRKTSESINKNGHSNKENGDSKSILDKYLESISFVDDWDNTKLTCNSSEIIDLENDNQNKEKNVVMLKSNKTKNGCHSVKENGFSPESSVDKSFFNINKKDKKKKKQRESANESYSTKENDFSPESSVDRNLSNNSNKECISITLTGSFKSTETSFQPDTFVKKQKKRKHIDTSSEVKIQPQTFLKKEKRKHGDSSSEESIQPQTFFKNEKKRKHRDSSSEESVRPQTFFKNEKKRKHRDSSSEESVRPQTYLKKEKKRKSRDSSSEDRKKVLSLLEQHLDLQNDSFHDKYMESESFESNNDSNDSRHNRLHDCTEDSMTFFTEDSSVLFDSGKKRKKKPNKSFENSEINSGASLEASQTKMSSTIYSSSEDSEYENLRSANKLDMERASLKSLAINVDFPVPRLHEICNRASIPTPQQRIKLAEENISVKTGKFVIAEDKQIRENWQSFLQLYNFKDVPEIFISLDRQYISNQQKQNFLCFLAQNLPDRTPYSVYLRFKNLMIQKKSGRFTEEEDQYILKQMEESGCHRNYMVEIAHHLQRTFYSVEKRIQKLKDKHTRKIRWRRQENLATFVKYLLRATGISPEEIDKLKNRHISSAEWRKLSKKLDGVPIRILKRAWLEQIHLKLFIPGQCFDLREAKLKLVQMFDENKEFDWRSVNWTKYASHFEGLTPLRVYSLMKNLVIKWVPTEKQHNLRKCIKALRKCETNDLAKHVIYKVKYQDGKIEDYGKKLNK